MSPICICYALCLLHQNYKLLGEIFAIYLFSFCANDSLCALHSYGNFAHFFLVCSCVHRLGACAAQIYIFWLTSNTKNKIYIFFYLHFTCFCAKLKRTTSEPAMRTALNSHTSHIRVHKYFSHVDDDCIHFSHSCFGRYGTKRKCKYGKVIKNGTTSDENNVRCSCCCCLRI